MIKIGDQFISRRDEMDSDENNAERITPAGSVWRVTHLADPNEKAWSIVCDETGGWINPNEDELRRDFYKVGSFEYRVREHWPDVADQVLGIIRGTIDPCTVERTDAWVRSCFNDPSREEQMMHAIDVLIEDHGCEAVFGQNLCWPDMEYSNQGDTYAPTILYDRLSHSFRVMSWGEWIEWREVQGYKFN